MNWVLKMLINGKGNLTDPRTATIKIVANAQSKSVAVAAIAQTHHAHYSHTLASPTLKSFINKIWTK